MFLSLTCYKTCSDYRTLLFRLIKNVTNPVYELPFTHEQRSPAHQMDYTTVALHPGLQFPSSIALMTHTAECTDYTHTANFNQKCYISHGLPFSHYRVLFSICHCDSYFTEPVLSFLSLVRVLPVFPWF